MTFMKVPTIRSKGTFFLPVGGEISWPLFTEANKDLPAAAATGKLKNLVITIGSPGGDPDVSWSMNSLLKSLDCNIITVASGRVFSAGIILFLSGDRRVGFKDSLFLFHPTVLSVQENELRARYKIEEELEGFKYDDNLFFNLLQSKLNCTEEQMKELTHPSKSMFVNANDALAMGILTEIVENISQI